MSTLVHDTETRTPSALVLPLVCAWLLMFVTFSFPGTSGAASAAELGAVAKAKLVVRLLALVLLGSAVWRQRHAPQLGGALAVLWPWGALGAWAVASVAWSPLKTVSLGQAASLVALLLLSLTIAVGWRNRRDTSRIMLHLCGALLVASSLLLVVALAFPASACMTRAGEGLFHATNSAATGGLGLLLLAGARCLWRWRWTRTMLWPGLAIHGAVLLLSTNRVALALVSMLLILLAVGFGNRGLVAIAGWLACAALGLYLVTDPQMQLVGGAVGAAATYAQRGQTLDQLGALSGREEMWNAIWQSYLESPWIGHGYFVSSRTGELYVWYSWANWTAHNLWLQVLVSTGLVGLSLLVWAIVRTGWLFACGWFRGAFDRHLGTLLAMLAVWQGGWSLFNESIAGPTMPESVVFFTLLGIGTAAWCRGRAWQLARGQTHVALPPTLEAFAGPRLATPTAAR